MELQKKCEAFINQITEGLDTDEINILRQNILMFINDSFNQKILKSERDFNYIAADSAIVEIIDDETNICFRRELPLRYEETGNGVSLIGEDISGKPSQISFISEAAYEKIKDLTGKGPDAPVCGGHDS